MGRTKTKKSSKAQNLPAPSNAPAIPALLEKAQSLIVQCDYELAGGFIQRILDQNPSISEATQAKEILGVVQLELGDVEAAKQTFTSLLETPSPPGPPPPAHLYLAQIISDEDPQLALKHYQAAVESLVAQLKALEGENSERNSEDVIELKSNIVRALIGQVEIWMDPQFDLCFDSTAPTTCENLLSTALQIDPDSSEALQSLASVRISQERPDEAKDCLERSWAKWKDLDLDSPHIPPIPARVALVRLFLELSLFTPALTVLHGVMSQDDEEVEAWYLEGWCLYLMAEQAKESGGKFGGNGAEGEEEEEMSWEELAKDARDRLETCRILHMHQDHPGKPPLEHTQELIANLEGMGIKATPPGEGDGEGEEGEGNWVDEDSDGEEGDGDVEMS